MSKNNNSINYNTITETPGVGASKQQLEILFGRYKFASDFCQNKDVLEVACGTGPGLGLLAKKANRVVGGDIDEENLRHAYRQYQNRANVEILKIDAHKLPFPDHSFDLILLYEAIYYLHDPNQFIKESTRVLRPGGILIICTINREWSDFNPSPFSTRYFSAQELSQLLESNQLQTKVFGAFPINDNSLKLKIISRIKRFAVRFHLIPKTMKGKEWIKKIVFGTLSPLPAEIHDGMSEYTPPTPISPNGACPSYKIIYITGRAG